MADLTLSQFIETVRLVCDQSNLVVSYDVRVLDNAVVKIRVFLTDAAFIGLYFNPANDNCSYALVRNSQRIYGADNAFVGWHVHPFESPDDHRLCEPVPFGEFLGRVERWMRQRDHSPTTERGSPITDDQ